MLRHGGTERNGGRPAAAAETAAMERQAQAMAEQEEELEGEMEELKAKHAEVVLRHGGTERREARGGWLRPRR